MNQADIQAQQEIDAKVADSLVELRKTMPEKRAELMSGLVGFMLGLKLGVTIGKDAKTEERQQI